MKKQLLLLTISLFCAFPSFSDCLLLYGNIKWEKIDSNEILLYKSGRAYAKVDLEYGTYITRYSDIKILDDSPCSYSSNVFLIDGDSVDVRRLEKF